MEQYISKTALVAEIEKLKDKAIYSDDRMKWYLYNDIIKAIDTIEVKDFPIWERVSPDTGQTSLYKDEDKSYLERFGYRIDLKDLDKLPKKNLKAQKGEEV